MDANHAPPPAWQGLNAVNGQSTNGSAVLIAGCGSPYGDDQVGWKVIDLLRRRSALPADCLVVREGADIVANLPGRGRLIIVDACQSGLEAGSITRLQWPDPRIAAPRSRALHGITLSDALQLADRLGLTPPVVDIFAIEIGPCLRRRGISTSALSAAVRVESTIVAELCEAAHA